MFKVLTLLFCSFCIFPIQGAPYTSNEELFPQQVSFSDEANTYELEITGVATRKKFFIKIYNVASYLQSEAIGKGDLLNEIMSDEWAKQLTLNWVYDVDLERVRGGYLESFKNVLEEHQFSELQVEIEQYLYAFTQDVQKGDIHILRWLPGGHIELFINNQPIVRITNEKFARTLWSLWFGSKSFVNRESLLTLTKG